MNKNKRKIISMPKTRLSFERLLLQAYRAGMNDGYGIEHTDIYNEEIRAERAFVARWGFKNRYDDVQLKTDMKF